MTAGLEIGDALERLSRRFAVTVRDDGVLRLDVIRAQDAGWRGRRRIVRGVALAGSALLLVSGLSAPDASLQWLGAASLAALCAAFGVIREMPAAALFEAPAVGFVHRTLEIAKASTEDAYRAGPGVALVTVDGVRITSGAHEAAGTVLVRVRRLGTDVFLVVPGRSFFVENFRSEDDAVDFSYHLSTAIGVPCEEPGVVPRIRATGLPWEPRRSRIRASRPYDRSTYALIAFLVALVFPVAHVLLPAPTMIVLGVRFGGYVLFDYGLQELLFVRWVRRAVESKVVKEIGIQPTSR